MLSITPSKNDCIIYLSKQPHMTSIVCKPILLLRPLSNDPRFIQSIYRYSHASKRFVEV